MTGNAIYVDISDVEQTVDRMRSVLGPDSMNRIMLRTFNEVRRKAKTIISKGVTMDYSVPQYWAKKYIGNGNITLDGRGMASLSLPMQGVKGVIGPRYKVSGKRRKITAYILRRGGVSTLPEKMKNQGGNAPFFTKARGQNIVMTRRTQKRYPIVRVAAISLPQMPLNLSEDRATEELHDYVWTRLDHHLGRALQGGI